MTIVERVAKRVSEIFPDVTTYPERQKSGFQVPPFCISKIMTVIKSRLFSIQDRSLSYPITYFTNLNRPSAGMGEVEQKLLNNFTRSDDYAAVRNRETTINQGGETLVVSFDLRLEMYPVQDGGKLERIEFNGGIQ